MAFIPALPALPGRATAAQQPQRPASRKGRRVARHAPAPARRTRMTAAPQQESIETAWPVFADKMRTTGEIPPLEEWHALLDICEAAHDNPNKAIWVVNLMRETGLRPTALTYEKVLRICARMDDRVSAFHLVEHMFSDKVLLGDVELPDGMEPVLRKILPPEAFE